MPTDAISLIKQDHQAVETLFKKLESDGFEQPEVVQQILTELTIHAEIEEQLLYPAVRRATSEGDEQVDEGEQEHTEVKSLIERIKAAGGDKVELELACTELMSVVRHHVEEEEGEMLPDFQKCTTPEQRQQLGMALMQAKQQMGGEIDLTKEDLLELARQQGIEGRSSMTKEQLFEAVQLKP